MGNKTWVFTFGLGNPWFSNYVLLIKGEYMQAREFVFENYGNKWCSQNDLKQFDISPYKIVDDCVIVLDSDNNYERKDFKSYITNKKRVKEVC